MFLRGGLGKTSWRRDPGADAASGRIRALGQTHLFHSCSPGDGASPRESCFSHLCGGDDDTAGLDGITGEKAPPWLHQVPALLNIPLFFIGLPLLGAFNVDENWIRVTPEERGPYVLRSLLHQDPSSNQTW